MRPRVSLTIKHFIDITFFTGSVSVARKKAAQRRLSGRMSPSVSICYAFAFLAVAFLALREVRSSMTLASSAAYFSLRATAS